MAEYDPNLDVYTEVVDAELSENYTFIKNITLQEKTATQNGAVTPDAGYDGLSKVDVDVPNTYTEDDEGKVVSGRALVAQTSTNITANDTYDTTLNDEVVVNVPNTYTASDEGKVVSSGALVAQGSDTVTENDTYDTTLISELTVNVSGGGGGSVNILSGVEVPTASVGEDGQVYLQYYDFSKLSTWETVLQNSMSVISKTDEGIEFKYNSGTLIGAFAYTQKDLTNVNTISWSITSGSHSYNSYATPRFAPFIYLRQSVGFADDSAAQSGIGAQSRIGTDNTTNSGSYDVSNLTGNYYILFNATGCDCAINSLSVDNNNKPIEDALLKVDGAWQSLIGSDINDVNTGD